MNDNEERAPRGDGMQRGTPAVRKEQIRVIEPRIPIPIRREPPSSTEALVAVARDAVDLVTEIARDAVALGKLEAQQAARTFIPRAAWTMVAIATGVAGGTLAIIALFMAAGEIIASMAARLAVLAVLLLLVTFFSLIRAARPASAAGMQGMKPTASSSEAAGGE